MSWNYRVMRHADKARGDCYRIHEVYYDEAGAVDGYSGEMAPGGETVEELRADLQHFAKALDQPVLDWPEDTP